MGKSWKANSKYNKDSYQKKKKSGEGFKKFKQHNANDFRELVDYREHQREEI